jgi:hypothetical protein
MESTQEQLHALKDIRHMMHRSSRFLSLSGLSGVFAGIYALAGAAFAWYYLSFTIYERCREENANCLVISLTYLGLDAIIVLTLSLSTALLLSYRKAKINGEKLFDHTALRLFINLFIPLLAGGIFCIALFLHSYYWLIAPAMLVFYGLALVNGSKYTLDDVRYLGILEVLVGLIACFFTGFGIIFWAIGFGILHIVYGLIMWYKYER